MAMEISILSPSRRRSASDRRSGGYRRVPGLHHGCRRLGKRGIQHRNGPLGRGSPGSPRDLRRRFPQQDETSAGTQGIIAAGNRAVRLYPTTLVITAKATVRALLSGSLDQERGPRSREPWRRLASTDVMGSTPGLVPALPPEQIAGSMS